MEASNDMALNLSSPFTHQLQVLLETKLMITIRTEPLPINKCLVDTNPRNELFRYGISYVSYEPLKGVISIFKDRASVTCPMSQN